MWVMVAGELRRRGGSLPPASGAVPIECGRVERHVHVEDDGRGHSRNPLPTLASIPQPRHIPQRRYVHASCSSSRATTPWDAQGNGQRAWRWSGWVRDGRGLAYGHCRRRRRGQAVAKGTGSGQAICPPNWARAGEGSGGPNSQPPPGPLLLPTTGFRPLAPTR